TRKQNEKKSKQKKNNIKQEKNKHPKVTKHNDHDSQPQTKTEHIKRIGELNRQQQKTPKQRVGGTSPPTYIDKKRKK
ncbi:hypothetical protein Q6254_28565, partial [Klebsiella pneumoniae]|nr:hypothetical protein [Klebsiella pneumoniae]